MSGISVHIGLNRVDPAHYQDESGQPWDGALAACENDARDMAALATAQGFTVTPPLLSAQATSAGVQAAIQSAARTLRSGDMFFLTYSGHGGQVTNTNPHNDPEPDGLDETWCLFDRQMIDDELHALYASFVAGVRIVVFSDSCHSGTVVRGRAPVANGLPPASDLPPARQLPDSVSLGTEQAHLDEYAGVQAAIPAARLRPPKADIVLVSGCQDHQFSRDGRRNGAFTGALLEAWQTPANRSSLRALHGATAPLIPPSFDQTPNYFVIGNDITSPALKP